MPASLVPPDIASLLTAFDAIGTHDLACHDKLVALRSLSAPISDEYAAWLEAFACIVADVWGPIVGGLQAAPAENRARMFHTMLLMHLETMTTTPGMAETLRYEREVSTSELHAGLERLAADAPDQRAHLTRLAAAIEQRLGTPHDQEVAPQVLADLDALVTWARSQRGAANVDADLLAAIGSLPCLRSDKIAIPIASVRGAFPSFDRTEMAVVAATFPLAHAADKLHAFYAYWARREGWLIIEDVHDDTTWRLELRTGRNEVALAVAKDKLHVRLRLVGYGHVAFE